MKRMVWTNDLVQRLRTLWAAGYASAAIGREFGVSQVAIRKKAQKLHLERRAFGFHGRREVGEAARSPKAHRIRVSRAHPEAITIDGHHLTLIELGRNQCHWPHGDPRDPDFHFCGRPTGEGKSYCPYHTARGTIRVGKKDLNTREFEGRSKFVFAMTEKAA
ncbi:MAG: hypothetical protein J0H10_15900 [Alphaproteobacteria bacterium]|nr:hypothetical protein [Alphaproteobacteria bacterium]